MSSKKSTKNFEISKFKIDGEDFEFFVTFLENISFNVKSYDVKSRFSKASHLFF